MSFKLSTRSLSKLEGVKPELVAVVKRAIEITDVDFAVIEGVRTVQRQRELVAKGASQTMKSKHITGDAVDLVAYIGDRISWELSLYDNIAAAVRAAAQELEVPIRWGGAWHVEDIRKWDGSMEDALNEYVELRKSMGKKIFIDCPHFELNP